MILKIGVSKEQLQKELSLVTKAINLRFDSKEKLNLSDIGYKIPEGKGAILIHLKTKGVGLDWFKDRRLLRLNYGAHFGEFNATEDWLINTWYGSKLNELSNSVDFIDELLEQNYAHALVGNKE